MLKKYLPFIAGISIGALSATLILSQNRHESQKDSFNYVRHLTETETTAPPSETGTPTAEATTAEDHAHAHEISDGGLIILFTFAVVFMGAVFKEIKKKTNIPYTPMVLIFGLICGYYHESWGIVGKAIHLANGIDPHTLLMIFIPALIFEGAYNTDAYVFNKSIWQVLIMAGPGVLITSFILAYSFVYIFGYKGLLTVSEALVIGSIISTTDPVAVVALLKELGASTRFKTILEGESLLNDGTAYVFFLVCLDIVVNGKFEFVPSLIKFLRLSLGGPIFGIIVGYLSSKWIGRIMKDSTLIVIITVFCTYLVFFLSENYIEVSGILALVSMGVYLSSFTKVNLSHDNDHAVHTIWGFCGFSLETLIFMITGTYIGGKLVHYADLTLTTSDIWKAFLFYPFLTLVRYIVMLIQLPFLNKVGYKISGVSAIILTYGGLRGAIALSLAMLVAVDERLDIHLRHICLFYVVTTIAFTVCVNGLTIKKVMGWTNFLKKDLVKEKVKYNMTREILVKTMKELSDMKKSDKLVGTHWHKVYELTRLQNYKILEELHHSYIPGESEFDEGDEKADTGRKLFGEQGNENQLGLFSNKKNKKGMTKDEENQNKLRSTLHKMRNKNNEKKENYDDIASSEDIRNIIADPFHNVRTEDVKRELRLRVYKLLKHSVQDKMDNNECPPNVVRSLKLLCDSCSDTPEKDICLREAADEFIGDHKTLKRYEKFSKIPILGKFFLKTLGDKIFFNYEFIATLIECCQDLADVELKDAAEHLDYKKELQEVVEEVIMDVTELEGLKDSLIHLFPGLINFIRTKLAAYRIVEYQRTQLKHFEHQGLISEQMSENWQEKLDKKIAVISKFKPNSSDFSVELKDSAYFLLDYPLFKELGEKEIKYLMDNRYLMNLDPGGIINEHFTKSRDYKKTRGGVSNIVNITSPTNHNLCTVNTVSHSKLYRVRIDVVKEIMRRDKKFEAKCYKTSFLGYIRYIESKNVKLRSILSELPDKRLNEIGETSIFRKLNKKDRFKLERGGFLISGRITKTIHDTKKKVTSRFTYKKLTFLLPSNSQYTCRENSLLLEFTIDVMKVSYKSGETKMTHLESPDQSFDEPSKSENEEKLINVVHIDEHLETILSKKDAPHRIGDIDTNSRQPENEYGAFMRTNAGNSNNNTEYRRDDDKEIMFVDELSSLEEMDVGQDWGRIDQIAELDDDISSEDKRGQKNVFEIDLKEAEE